ncbi:Putative membrane protein (plasmid) [Amycolatopsis japonica]|uniref:Putative membrane protein n=1 Tax=Amycolatopsis japonica TaxID=208439 RepID=A0A075VEI7_9PSEU|nr:hypothetical protein [Amycolatopsis japonica]AIG81325.1 Putative membrane protein [Amycolatopsis japonica]
MTLPKIPRLDPDLCDYTRHKTHFLSREYMGIPLFVTVVSGWVVGYAMRGDEVWLQQPGAAPEIFKASGGTTGHARQIVGAIITALLLAEAPVATATLWMHYLIDEHGHEEGAARARAALGVDELYRSAYTRWEIEREVYSDSPPCGCFSD